VNLPANFASMSVDELWEIHEEISKLLEAKMLAEKKMLDVFARAHVKVAYPTV
jgi:hypothetical protein